MKKILITAICGFFMLTGLSLSAQSMRVAENDYSAAEIFFAAPELHSSLQQVGSETFLQLTFDGSTPSTKLGLPNLPILSEMIEIPLCSEVVVSVSEVRTKQLPAASNYVMPVQPSPSKSDVGPLPFVFDSAFYATDAFTDAPAAWVETIGVARDRNLAILRISPISYNPVSGQLSMITSMKVKLTYRNADRVATEQMHSRYFSPQYTVGHSLLSTLPSTKAIRNAAPLHYLIVAHSSFRGAFDDFVNWKKRQGFIVTVAYTGDANVGTQNTQIANFIKGFYTNATDELPAPTYLLLIGDHQQIPAFDSRCTSPDNNHVTDLYFTTWTEGDNLPDCYYGRFSARTVAELTPQVEKTIFYERYDFPDPSYLGRGVLIAGEDGGYSSDYAYQYADPAMDYFAKYYVNAANGYNDVYYYKNNVSFSPAGVTVTGNSRTTATATALRALYNQGCGWVNYSAHGFDDSWSTPNFTANHAASLTNTNKPAVMIGNCCLSGKFNTQQYDACLGEALLRRGNNGGAVVYIGATNSTYWAHDFCWGVGYRTSMSNTMDAEYDSRNLGAYDRHFHTHNETYSNWRQTAGSIINAGNYAVQVYGSYVQYYWEVYELFGDPSLMPWLGVPSALRVEADEVVTLGIDSYSVRTEPYAYVAITHPSTQELVVAAFADANGNATLALPSSLFPDTYELAVWAQNRQPVFRPLQVIVNNAPFIQIARVQPTAVATPDSVISFNFTLTNLGNQYPSECLITLSSDNGDVLVVQPEGRFGTIAPGDTVDVPALCSIYIPADMEDGTIINLTAIASFGGTSTKHFSIPVVASRLSVVHYEANPVLMADSSSVISFQIRNNGHAASHPTQLSLVSDFGLVSSTIPSVSLGALAPNQDTVVTFPLTMASNLPNISLPFYLYADSDNSAKLISVSMIRIGSSEIETFESGDFTRFSWSNNSHPWTVTEDNPYMGRFAARSMANLSNRSESRMSIYWTSSVDDSISFYYKVSSEEGYDFFSFRIDGVEMVSASGEVDWTYFSCPVTSGSHNFAFSYSKDYYSTEGSDCAWIDNVHFPYSGVLCSFVVDSACVGEEYYVGDTLISTSEPGVVSYFDSTQTPVAYYAITVLPSPVVSIEAIHAPNGNCILLKAHGADSYLWSTGDTTPCIVVCPQQSSAYSVVGYRQACSGQAVYQHVGIQQPLAAERVNVFPNPATSHVTVQASHIRRVSLVNLVGQTLSVASVEAPSTVISLQNLTPGVYFLRVETIENTVVKKVIVK